MHKAGKVRDIGLSNFNIEQIKRIQANSKVPVSVLTVEVHAYLQNKDLVSFCKEQHITVLGYSPLGSPDRPPAAGPGAPDAYDPPLLEPVVQEIAKKHGKSPGQVSVFQFFEFFLVCMVCMISRC